MLGRLKLKISKNIVYKSFRVEFVIKNKVIINNFVPWNGFKKAQYIMKILCPKPFYHGLWLKELKKTKSSAKKGDVQWLCGQEEVVGGPKHAIFAYIEGQKCPRGGK